jgi:hypothetical protein
MTKRSNAFERRLALGLALVFALALTLAVYDFMAVA